MRSTTILAPRHFGVRSRAFATIIALAPLQFLALATSANASPINYNFSSGTVEIRVTAGAQTLVGTTTVPFGGGTATFDPATGILSEFNWVIATSQTLDYGTGAGATLGTYGGATSTDISGASLSPNSSPAYSPGVPFPAGPGAWFVSVSNVLTTGMFGLPFNNDSLAGQITTSPGLFTFGPGVAIGQLPGGLFGEADGLQINMTVTWRGTPAPAPEPATGLLVVMSMLGLVCWRRRVRAP